MAEKISAAGLDCPPGSPARVLEDIGVLVQRLKAFDSAPAGPLPHAGLIEEIDRLLVETAFFGSLQFHVDGEWTSEEMSRGRGAEPADTAHAGRSAMPTPVSAPLAQRRCGTGTSPSFGFRS
jgi:hypothetical protein